ncbi:MAG: hypothetical protein BV458_09470 [Thermoplasmata archaeon M9B2D]|nr:MAG: hypothetical protein BV458_09470 [Thermoplasmata archaeon M9B2D]
MKMKKILAVSIILLFIGVAVAPSFNQSVVTASTEDDLVEVTSQACGITGYKDTTVKLTREQYQNLESYLVEFRDKLNQISTREEAIPIFKEAVVELDTYGLLAKGMSVEQVQKLVVSSARTSLSSVTMKRIREPVRSSFYEHRNLFCLVAGQTDYTTFENAGSIFFYVAAYLVKTWDIMVLCAGASDLFTRFCRFSPLGIMNRISLGGYDYYSDVQYPASGWLTTVDIFGVMPNEGEIHGTLPIEGTLNGIGPFPGKRKSPGVIGFTGLKIGIGPLDGYLEGTFFYLGSALWVKVSTEPVESHNLRSSEIVEMIP